MKVKVKVKSPSHEQLFTTPWSLPGSSIYGIFQARVLEWLAIAFSEQYLNLCKEERQAHLREDGTLSLPGAPREQKRKEG